MKKLPPDATRYFDLILSTTIQATAVLKDNRILVYDQQSIENLWYGGFFGYGEISRKHREPDSPIGVTHLLPEEAVYLMKDVKILRAINEDGKGELDAEYVWRWALTQPRFQQLYASYRHYRLLGYVVRSGLKYGSEWLLYKRGPVFDHAVSCVRVFSRDSKLVMGSIVAPSRICGNVRKSLRVCLLYMTDHEIVTWDDFVSAVSVSDVEMKRWIPERTRSNVKINK